jgi:hypothetical protein
MAVQQTTVSAKDTAMKILLLVSVHIAHEKEIDITARDIIKHMR